MPVSLPNSKQKNGKESQLQATGIAGNITYVEEKPVKTSTSSKFKRNLLSQTVERPASAQYQSSSLNEADIAKDLLMSGFSLSYIDFYNLIKPRKQDEKINPPVLQSVEDMIVVKGHLIDAELHRRKGNTKSVFGSYKQLASFFASKCDWKTSIFFYEKGLEIAQLAMDVRAEMLAYHELGCVYFNMEEYLMSEKYHLRHEELGSGVEMAEEVAKANAELYKVFVVKASKFEKEGNFESALSVYQQSLESAKKCWGKASESEANGNIGNLLLARGMAEESLPYLQQQAKIATDMGIADGRCRASSSLAYAYDILNNTEKAITELTLVRTISEQDGDALLQSKANRELGILYSKLGKLQEAYDALQKHYSLLSFVFANQNQHATQTDTHPHVPISDLEISRTLVGVSRGNLLMGSYVLTIQSSLIDLINWKLNRQNFLTV